MKVGLRQQDGIAILDVTGGVDSHNFNILKAGLSKLLRDGKNKIVLHFVDTPSLESEVIREVAILDVFARELAGKIVLASSNQELKEQVKLFAKPPVVPILSTVELAIEFLRKAAANDEEEGGETVADLKKILATRDAHIQSLEARLKQLDPAVIQGLRKEKAELADKLKLLENQVDALLKEKRGAIDPEGQLEKITALEETVKRLSKQAAAGAKA